MEVELRKLVGLYGFQAVKECLDQEMKTTYTYLQQYFSTSRKPLENSVCLPSSTSHTVHISPPTSTVHVEKEKEKEEKERTVSLLSAPKKEKKEKEGKLSLTKVPAEVATPQENPESLLTKENLELWMSQGKSYAEIARDTGNNQKVVSGIAKGFGLKVKVKPHFYKKKQ